MVIVSPDALMVPQARMVDWDKAEPHFRLGPASESLAPGGPDLATQK